MVPEATRVSLCPSADRAGDGGQGGAVPFLPRRPLTHSPCLPQVNKENVVKVGHRQVVNMIRQGGNHLVLKVVTVTRNLDPDDTARKKGARPAPCTTPHISRPGGRPPREEEKKPDREVKRGLGSSGLRQGCAQQPWVRGAQAHV